MMCVISYFIMILILNMSHLNHNSPVVSFPLLTNLNVHFALNVHEDQPSSEANCNNHKLCPEWPLQLSRLDFFSGSIYQYIEGPDHAGDRYHVERDGAAQLLPLHG